MLKNNVLLAALAVTIGCASYPDPLVEVTQYQLFNEANLQAFSINSGRIGYGASLSHLKWKSLEIEKHPELSMALDSICAEPGRITSHPQATHRTGTYTFEVRCPSFAVIVEPDFSTDEFLEFLELVDRVFGEKYKMYTPTTSYMPDWLIDSLG